ncbi:hypothetical protein SKAU_G00268420 [Synaphobranchus kaupii]|uniref:Uncharacterized protein n=1 Tax=Synaphobranchus kaupii TaxID=118154 RepID=A0A9Q1INB0_SYNKA|nr:hypothetical protein SKAU_G00268420 [Synaphobranchus kaupii]
MDSAVKSKEETKALHKQNGSRSFKRELLRPYRNYARRGKWRRSALVRLTDGELLVGDMEVELRLELGLYALSVSSSDPRIRGQQGS